jgi:hypothetical protein
MRRGIAVAAGVGFLLLTSGARAEAPAPVPGPEHKKLEAFVGKWALEGVGREDPAAPESKVVGTIEARWILGGFFVEFNHQWTANGRTSRALEVVGYDPEKKRYTSHVFRPTGTVESCDVTFDDRTYVISGTSTARGRDQKWTCTWIFGADWNSQTGKCETWRGSDRWTDFSGRGTKAAAR